METFYFAKRSKRILFICIMGTTVESAIDPLADIIDLREEFEAKGLSFTVHGDAAWGGYFMAMLHGDLPSYKEDDKDIVPGLAMSSYGTRHYNALRHADSITIDPHKAGFIPYPAGAICFKDQRFMAQTIYANPYIMRPGEANVGVYGLQGSKPGAAAISCHLAHKCVPLDMTGYGLLHSQIFFATKVYYSLWQVMHDPADNFIMKTGVRIAEEHDGVPAEEYEAKRQWIRSNVIDIDNDYSSLATNPEVMNYLTEIGPDLGICTMAVNFKNDDGTLNTDVEKANQLNQFLFERFSKTSVEEKEAPEIIFTSTTVASDGANTEYFKQFQERLGLTYDPKKSFYYLISTLMCPWPTADDWPPYIESLVRDAIVDGIAEFGLTNHPGAS